MVVVLGATVASLHLGAGIEGLNELVQAADAAISLMARSSWDGIWITAASCSR
jgi:hypothetical protein